MGFEIEMRGIPEEKINKWVPLVPTYHPSLEKISGIVRHHWKEIEKCQLETALATFVTTWFTLADRR
jgi:hypothetical protein